MDVAQAIFNEVAEPYIGIVTIASHKARAFPLNPWLSLPTNNMVGAVKS
jgi:hypothetical protein